MRIMARAAPWSRACFVVAISLAVTLTSACGHASAQEGWTVRSFDANYTIEADGNLSVIEDIDVDYGASSHHGIFRDIPVRYSQLDGRTRVVKLSVVSVEDSGSPIEYSKSDQGENLRLKIGDPHRLASGVHHYRISYKVQGALDAFADHDELYWNVTGNAWVATIQQASADVEVPSGGIARITCYEGQVGSQDPCTSSNKSSSASFRANSILPPGAGLTVVVGLQKGSVAVQPPMFLKAKSAGDQLANFSGVGFAPIALASALFVVILAWLAAIWWVAGRDRWYGDVYYLTGNTSQRIKPPFARETIVVEYAPPEIGEKKRQIRPAEMGLLLDEHADTLDISGTIVDLVVRGYIRIDPTSSEGTDGEPGYEMVKLKEPDHDLLRYERLLMDGLFGHRKAARLTDIENRADVREARDELYRDAVHNKFFPTDPSQVRARYRVYGIRLILTGAIAVWLLGALAGMGIVGGPILFAGAIMFVLAHAMPRRTALGREVYRRCLGFRLFLVTAGTQRQRFLEEKGVFEKYLPFAIVLGCTHKWAKVFKELGIDEKTVELYTSHLGIVPSLAVAIDHAVSPPPPMSSTTAAGHGFGVTGGGFGGGGFGGGGFAGGGGGGGGGGVW